MNDNNNNNNNKWEMFFHLDHTPNQICMSEKKELTRIHLNRVHAIELMQLQINNETKQ